MSGLRLLAGCSLLAVSSLCGGANDLRIEVDALPEFARYEELLAQPGILAVALENNGLSPSLSSKLKISEQGRGVEIRNASLRYLGKKDAVYSYEASYRLGLGSANLGFPASLDLSRLAEGKVVAILSPPLAGLIPDELTERIRLKVAFVANADAQKKVISYLDQKAKTRLVESVLIDAYNKSGGPAVQMEDVGDALPLSDQWMLFLTLVIWLLGVPALFLWRRRQRAKPSRN